MLEADARVKQALLDALMVEVFAGLRQAAVQLDPTRSPSTIPAICDGALTALWAVAKYSSAKDDDFEVIGDVIDGMIESEGLRDGDALARRTLTNAHIAINGVAAAAIRATP